MSDIDTIKAEIKKLNGQATQLKMDLHDLSEDLPTGWEKIPEIAEKTFSAYQQLTAARKKLAEIGG
ncbi:MAG: CCE_0567 family metalloprotein [Methylophilus sp.]